MTEIEGGWATVLTAVAALLLLLVWKKQSSRKPQVRLPPGPIGWPIVGSLPLLGRLPHQSLYELAKKFGPIMYMHLGSVPALVITSPQLAAEVLRTHDQIMSSRPLQIVGKHLSYNGSDVAMSPYGDYWRYLRRICTNGLLTPKRIVEFREVREKEVLAGVQFILEESEKGIPVNMAEFFSIVNVNNMTQMMMNKRYCFPRSRSEKDVPEGSTFYEIFQEVFVLLGSFNVADYIPILTPFDLQGFSKRMKIVHSKVDSFLDEVIGEHRKRLGANIQGAYKEDFIDTLLSLGTTKEFSEPLPVQSIKALLGDMLAGASDTSAVTSQWVLTELVRHPDMMRRVQEEIELVVGRDRLMVEEDLPSLTYLQAVVKETFRLHPPGPMLIPHESAKDCEIRGYHIPAKTLVLINQWAIHRDPALWERPTKFHPDRWLDSKIDLKGNDFEYLPFGSGKRMCPGWHLGLRMVTFALGFLLHSIDFTPSDVQKPSDVDISETFGLVLYKKNPLNVLGEPRLPHHVIYAG